MSVVDFFIFSIRDYSVDIEHGHWEQEVEACSLYTFLFYVADKSAKGYFIRPQCEYVVVVEGVDQDVECGAEASGDDHLNRGWLVSYAEQAHQVLERPTEDEVCGHAPDCA